MIVDSLLLGPLLSTMAAGVLLGMLGVVLFFRKESLLSETLSHASYPGIALALFFSSLFFPGDEKMTLLFILLFGSLFCLAAMQALDFLKKRKVSSDASLAFVLATFFGLGLLLMSYLQSIYPVAKKKGAMLLFGQAATLTTGDALFFALIASLFALWVAFHLPKIRVWLFDPSFCPMRLKPVVVAFLLLGVMAAVFSVGVVLLSGLLIAPAIGATYLTNRLGPLFSIAASIGALSGGVGTLLADHFAFATGPSIVLIASLIALLAMLFSPKKGLLFRLYRIGAFHKKCAEENYLKGLMQGRNPEATNRCIRRLKKGGWIFLHEGKWALTMDGKRRGALILRLHRLWEVYAASELGLKGLHIHNAAEAMEHILTASMGKELDQALFHPKRDPHLQPIPEEIL